MRELLFIIAVIAVLLVLTAIRYRKQIAAMIGMARMLRQAKQAAGERAKISPQAAGKSNPLVNCSKCNIWVPQARAVKFREGFICSNVCEKQAATAERPAIASD